MQKSYAENNNLLEEESIHNSLNYHTNSILIEVVDPPMYRGLFSYLLFIMKIFFIGTILIGIFYGIIYLFSN